MSEGLTVLAVDDERPALDDLVRMLRGSSLVGAVEAVSGARDALLRIGERRFDALFLDVRMPGLDGVELARVLSRFADPPAIVFVSAYETAAVDAFELRALDYLMKPVGRVRLDDALRRVAARAAGMVASGGGAEQGDAGPAPADADVVPVDNLRGGTRLLARSEILYLEARGDYVRIVSEDGRFLLRARLGDLERRWEPYGFVRVHRGYLANLRRASELRPLLNGTAELRFPDGHAIPISRRQVGELRRRLHV
jgi:DNA-binding LytR/AlgR family response regulator